LPWLSSHLQGFGTMARCHPHQRRLCWSHRAVERPWQNEAATRQDSGLHAADAWGRQDTTAPATTPACPGAGAEKHKASKRTRAGDSTQHFHSCCQPHLTSPWPLFLLLSEFPGGRQPSPASPLPPVLPLQRSLPWAQPLRCPPAMLTRHHPGRQKATLPEDTHHYPHHHWQPQPSLAPAAAVQVWDTHVHSVPACVISASLAVVPAKPGEPQQSIHEPAGPPEGITLWHRHRQWGEPGQMRREPRQHGMRQPPCSHRLSAGLQGQDQMPLSSSQLRRSADFQVSLSIHEVNKALRITWG